MFILLRNSTGRQSCLSAFIIYYHVDEKQSDLVLKFNKFYEILAQQHKVSEFNFMLNC